MNDPIFDRRSQPRAHPESDIFEIRRPGPPHADEDHGGAIDFPAHAPAIPPAASEIACEVLATTALEHGLAGEQPLARRGAEDSLSIIESLASARGASDRATAARAALTTGETFLLLHEAHRAEACFELAVHVFDTERDLARAAQARVGLAKALLALRDPSARAVLEDAGEIFEDLGDEEAALAIDFALRQAQAELEESPRSFHARRGSSRRSSSSVGLSSQ